MPFLCTFLPGSGAARVDSLVSTGDVTIGGAAAVTGRTTSAGFTSSIAGTAATPAYNWTAGAGGTGNGMHLESANQLRIDTAGAYVANLSAGLLSVSGAGFFNSYLQVTGSIINPARTANISAVGTTVAVTASLSSTVNVTLSGGSIISTAAPFMADGVDGQEIWLQRDDDAGDLTLSDEGTLAGSNLYLSAATIALGPRDVLGLKFSTALGGWVQIAYANVL